MIVDSFDSHSGVLWFLGNNSKQSLDFVFHTAPDATTPTFVHLPLPHPLCTLSYDCAPSASCVSISHHEAACCQHHLSVFSSGIDPTK